jgi:hypothetical protein
VINQEKAFHESFPWVPALESLANSNSSKMPAIATLQVRDCFLQSLNVGHAKTGIHVAGFGFEPAAPLAITTSETVQQ